MYGLDMSGVWVGYEWDVGWDGVGGAAVRSRQEGGYGDAGGRAEWGKLQGRKGKRSEERYQLTCQGKSNTSR